MRVLTIDIGNSRTKLDLWEEDTHKDHKDLTSSEIDFLKGYIRERRVEGIIVCSVSKNISLIVDSLTKDSSCRVVGFTSGRVGEYNVEESYRQSLGTDRLAAFIGAETLFPLRPKIIIDSGTALTVDVANAEGKFCGGNISLGITSRLKALHEFTARLPLVSIEGKISDFGTSTEEAIRNGAILGTLGEIIFDIENAKDKYKIEIIMLTGGDGPLIKSQLENLGYQVVYDPYLVSRGLVADFKTSA